MKRVLIAVLVVLLLAAAALLIYLFVIRPGSAPREDVIRVSGTIEVTDVQASFKIPGRLEVRLVSEGNTVRAGQLIGRLESTDLAHEVALRKAERAEAEAALAELVAGSRQEEIEAVRTEVTRAEAEAKRLKADYERQKTLRERDVISDREYDIARTALAVAEARVREASERFALVEQGPRTEMIDRARARLAAAGEAIALAEERLRYASLASPIDGLVLAESAEAGEVLGAGAPIVSIADLAAVWLRAYVNETDLGRVKVGQTVRVATDSYPGKVYEGTISFVASQAEFTPKNVQTQKERVKLVYRIKVDLANPAMELKPGMPADGEILLAGPEPSAAPAPSEK